MGSLQKQLVYWWVVPVCSVLIDGCASRLWIVSTSLNTADYQHSNIGMLPIVADPALEDQGVPLAEMQQVVAEEFSSFGVHMGSRPKETTTLALDAIREHVVFPYTPGQLARVGAALNLDAAVGISVVSWYKGDNTQKASIDLIITFVDVKAPQTKYWMLSGSWSADKSADLPEALRLSLGAQLIDVKWYARAHLIPWGGTKVYPSDEPLVTISSSVPDLGTSEDLPLRSIPLTATGIYEGGIESLRVINETSHFDYTVYSRAKSSVTAAPISLSGSVQVPLSKGGNKIIVTALATSGKEGQRVLKVTSSARPKIHFVPISVTNYKEFPAPLSVQYQVEALRAAAGQNNAVDLTDTQDLKPTKYELANLLQSVSRSSGTEDPAVVLFAGRIAHGLTADSEGKSGATLFLLMKDSSRSYPGIGSVSLKDIRNFTLPRWTLLLDVCSDEDLAPIKEQLASSLPPGSIAEVRSCSRESGESVIHAAADWVRSYSDPRYPQANISVLQTVKSRVPSSILVAPVDFVLANSKGSSPN
jgi:hypothetical protein